MGNATCAADGMCQTKCPVAINTGALIKSLRADEMSKAQKTNRFAQVCFGLPFVHALLGAVLCLIHPATTHFESSFM